MCPGAHYRETRRERERRRERKEERESVCIMVWFVCCYVLFFVLEQEIIYRGDKRGERVSREGKAKRT